MRTVFVVLLSALSLLSSSQQLCAQNSKNPEVQAQLLAALRKQTDKLTVSYCEALDKVAVWASSKGLRSQAIDLYKQIRSLQREYEGLDDLKETIKKGPKEPVGDDPSKDEKSLASKLKSASSKHAKKLYSLALKCFQVGLFTKAFDLLSQIIDTAGETDTTAKKARKILGFTWDRKAKVWITVWEANQRKKHYLTDEGWVANKNKKKWESGQRLYKSKWVSIEEEKRIRSRNEFNPYLVESENFAVKTNLGRKEAWEYAILLEEFNREFYRFFIGYYDQVAGAKLLFKRGAAKAKHQVYIFPSRTDYLVHVKGEQGNDKLLQESAGFYSPTDRLSRFYYVGGETPEQQEAARKETLSTLYHEIAHQLFAETKETQSGGSQGNNWVVEGIASYVETWKKIDGKWYPGRDIGHQRLMHAAAYLSSSQSKGFLKIFAAMDNKTFHEGEARGLHYSLSCAMSHFFFHSNDEIYKEDFVRFISAYYAGKVKKDSLLEYLTHPKADSWGSLETQIRSYLKGLQKKAGRSSSKPRRR